ncbi:MAG: YggS family pyridoxal phosphate-dependent enzyme [Bacteroidetes bacterium]|nr:MAG: YggS family pyridoxal phosphate-dependent enzyme [Bacteroidota bacterium]
MGEIAENYYKLVSELPAHVKLVAVTKTRTPSEIMELYNCGHRLFGESKAQEMVPKYEELPKDIQWHMVGHLQSNKVKYIAPFVKLIQSVDSFKLLKTINKEAVKNDIIIDCLLQIHIAEEESKFGFELEELREILESEEFSKLKNIRIKGLMCMATFTDDVQQIRKEFRILVSFFKTLKEKYFNEKDDFHEKSMGMTDDWQIAIGEGSTMVRVGTALFGERPK